MVILVTGGAGFIGSFVVDQLLAAGHDIRVVDRLHPGAHTSRPDYLDPRVDYLWGDVGDPGIAARAVAGVDVVCRQAAMVGLGLDFADASAYVRDNDVGTAVLLRALHDRSFRGRIVVASSMVVYGEGAYRCHGHGSVRPSPRTRDDLDARRWEPVCPECGRPLTAVCVTEECAPDPRNVYAATKLHQEHLCSAYGREHDAEVIALRYHNVYGPRMPRDTPYAVWQASFGVRWRLGGRRRSSRTADRCETSCTSPTWRERTCTHSPRPSRLAVSTTSQPASPHRAGDGAGDRGGIPRRAARSGRRAPVPNG